MSARRERVIVRRDVEVACVPDGTPAELPAGTLVQITQALGASFTLLVDGQLMRLAGADADAIGKPVPVAPVVVQAEGPEGVWRRSGRRSRPATTRRFRWTSLSSA